MLKMFTRFLALALFALALPLSTQAKTFYWISHGSPADPVWTYFLNGANMWAKDTGQTVKTSFHNGDVPSQQEAIRSAIAAKADAIVTTSPDPGSLVDVVKEARAAGHSGHQLQHAGREGELQRLCRRRSRRRRQGLGAISRRPRPGEVGRFRLDAGRGSRRKLRRRGGKGDRDGLQAAQHHLGSHRRHARSGERHLPHERLPHRQSDEGQGDHRARRSGHRLDQAGLRPGRREGRAKFRSSAGAIRATRPPK